MFWVAWQIKEIGDKIGSSLDWKSLIDGCKLFLIEMLQNSEEPPLELE